MAGTTAELDGRGWELVGAGYHLHSYHYARKKSDHILVVELLVLMPLGMSVEFGVEYGLLRTKVDWTRDSD